MIVLLGVLLHVLPSDIFPENETNQSALVPKKKDMEETQKSNLMEACLALGRLASFQERLSCLATDEAHIK